ncbi:signal peptidase II [Schaalia sp. 19OD2882]|uniref:signal peptidase II n=1 Tax=Schaalia sp. 19OD2882 TaxID=2794089 RepID=UPI001C1EEC85|nr:signal peptidase II [Schaalia sp. 19OD2882]QWW18933.1 signal peptidase II [Schaalia sp. 19OD2882]
MNSQPTLRRRALIAGGVALAAALSDQASKIWALGALDDGQRVPLIGKWISLVLIHNSGAAFSLGSSATWIFTILSVIVLVALVAYVKRGCSAATAAAVGLLGGGAVGNLVDRLIRPPGIGVGHVVDFINYNDYFIGNVADIWIVLAALWLAVIAARTPSPVPQGQATSDPSREPQAPPSVKAGFSSSTLPQDPADEHNA